MSISFVSLDPGTHLTGYAIWNVQSPAEKLVLLSTHGVIKASRNALPPRRIRVIGAGFQQLLMKFQPTYLLYEGLEFQRSAAGSAASRKGHLFMVAHLIGYLNCLWDRYVHWQLVVRKSILPFSEPVELRQRKWKGNLPKSIIRTRVNHAFKLELGSGNEEHIADAIGLGDYYLKSQGWKVEGSLGLKDKRRDIAMEEPPKVELIPSD